jgi:hypothetical protein
MDDVFLVALPFLAIALLLAIITPEQRLGGRDSAPPQDEAAADAEASATAALH